MEDIVHNGGFVKEVYSAGKLEILNEILDKKEYFIPANLLLLDRQILENNDINEIGEIESDDNVLIEVIGSVPKEIFEILTLNEIKKFIDANEKQGHNSEDVIVDELSKIRYVEKESTSPNVINWIKKTASNYSLGAFDLIEKVKKFDAVSRFIPSIEVLSKYPENQIEKFNKKLWFSLARYRLYNESYDAKCALVEAMLSFGVFEADENQEEKLGMLYKFANNIPKTEFVVEKRDDFIDEHFEIIEEKVAKVTYIRDTKKLLSDENLIKLFGGREKARDEIRKLDYKCSKSRMEENLNKEYVTEKYKEIMTYIYKTGYVKEERKAYKIRLKTDIERLKAENSNEKDKEKRRSQKQKIEEIEQKIRKIYNEVELDGFMTPSKLHRIFGGMNMEYKPGFYEFFKNNLTEILNDKNKQLLVTKIQRQWDKIVEMYLGQKINFEKCERCLFGVEYNGVNEGEEEIARLSSMCGYSQDEFDDIKAIYQEQLERTKSSIPQIKDKKQQNGYSYTVLRLDDPIAIFVGELTGCCQALGNDGESCMRHSVTSENGRVLVVKDENEKILAQSWLWRNHNILCFDNVEAIEKDSTNKKVISNEILDAVKMAAKDFVKTDAAYWEQYEKEKIKELEQRKENGEISESEFEEEKDKIQKIRKGQQLTKVTVGVGYTDIDLKDLPKDKQNVYPEEYVEYINDSRKQLILYEDKSIEHIDTEEKTIAHYEDDKDSKYLVDINIEKEDFDFEDEHDEEEYDIDEYNFDKYDFDEYYPDEYGLDEDDFGEDDFDEEEIDEEDEIDENDDKGDREYIEKIMDVEKLSQEQIENSELHFDELVYKEEGTDMEEITDGFSEQDNNKIETKIRLEDIRKTINYANNRAEARKALKEIEKVLENIR